MVQNVAVWKAQGGTAVRPPIESALENTPRRSAVTRPARIGFEEPRRERRRRHIITPSTPSLLSPTPKEYPHALAHSTRLAFGAWRLLQRRARSKNRPTALLGFACHDAAALRMAAIRPQLLPQCMRFPINATHTSDHPKQPGPEDGRTHTGHITRGTIVACYGRFRPRAPAAY